VTDPFRKVETMDSQKHTQGPWKVTDDADHLLGAVVGVCDKESEETE
jgi:hypothetical protein